MGKKIKLYTGTGDDGYTYSPIVGDRVAKDHLTIELEGAIDETLSQIGFARSLLPDRLSEVDAELAKIQLIIFKLGTMLLSKGSKHKLTEDDIKWLESVIDRRMPEDVELFVIPYGHPSSTALHVARSVARRLERIVVKVLREYGLDLKLAIKAVNRISDALFSLALYVNRELGFREDVFKPRS